MAGAILAAQEDGVLALAAVELVAPSAGTLAGEPLPTIVMLHGFGGSKTSFEADSPEGDDPDSPTLYHWNNNFFAKQGYAVVNYFAPTAFVISA